ncbi:deoxyribodipyrimidine photo-lyase [Conexibacter sp. JD483]|uniref:cryptochrome/photolyase family protein n=1 Tax=unclassified Conexibacter TaxID=2627773 RepID=UPI00271EF64E|nr:MULTISPECIES: deoxyribodipyrimidine photo-lyase [unclassified Conexibacter]MDO8186727.1 deoxyribodipyrimidine photo-lyase [Conexibacter sp. CPCC 205706]MDO8199013.1 deoxyribodipyrimidine photo-lyase [Conexibacter sp. CPCC 205762]MDR9368465.1 deoxyribodipyrimidine photo-lyase [Conexibacter sp. JD483]
MAASDTTALVWLRRDLRLHDHPPLVRALAEHARVVPVFVLDPALLRGRFASGPRTAFLLACLRSLDDDLRARGSGLVVRVGRPERELVALAREAGASAVLWASDATPYALARDRRVRAALAEAEVEAVPGPGNFVADVGKPRTRGGTPFSVFTPFHRSWQQLERRPVHRAPAELPPLPSRVAKGSVPPLEELVGARVAADAGALAAGSGSRGGSASATDAPLGEPAVEPGEAAAREVAERWLDDHLPDYARDHDRLAGGASQLSAYLRFGLLSPRELEQRAERRGGEGGAAFARQLAWRDFYAHVLLHNPANLRREHQERMRRLRWEDDPDGLAAWQEGRTGFPLVDAAMRQLRGSGWMHNRARLVVGSFLTKDLQLDWRAGEAWFMRWLLDGDVASNNGNWQWIASVGVDPAPAFRRILNPALQQQRHDPDGAYVRRWVPELAGVPDELLSEPWRMTDEQQQAAGCRIGSDYPAPLVDHREERQRALARYRETAGG